VKLDKTTILMGVIGCMLMLAPLASADDVAPPQWRGVDRTVFAEWTFDRPDTDADNWSSHPGEVEMETPYYEVDESSVFHETYGTRQNVWEINDDFGLDFYMPNFPDGEYKDGWIQITYLVDEDYLPIVDPDLYVEGEHEYDVDWDHSGTVYHEDGWITDTFWFYIEPNPEGEWIGLYVDEGEEGSFYPAYIDQVIIDTICVPEPATLSLLAVAGVAVIRRRRK